MHVHAHECVYVRVHVCVCARACMWGEGGACAFIMGCPFSYLPENSNCDGIAWQAKAVYILQMPCSQTQEKEHTVFCLSLLYSYIYIYIYIYIYDILI